ncbi:MAG: glycosyltransferase [Caulobacteraceae bacterium]
MRLEIIIPVHNGAGVLDATLRALASQALGGARVTVVFNGCSDGSEIVARRGLLALSERVDVRELHNVQGARVAALNSADEICDGHRLYLDQDAVLGPGAVSAIRAQLEAQFHFVGLRAVWRTRSAVVRAAMHAWNKLPYVTASPVTAGVYAVSSSGRQRWNRFPDRLPDDKFARLHFRPEERTAVEGVTYEVDAPSNFRDLIAVRKRYAEYNRALKQFAPELLRNDLARSTGLQRLLLRPADVAGALILAAAEVGARIGDPDAT